jgi:poly-beta-1,6-N-acetyl-D-glucosamine synthase
MPSRRRRFPITSAVPLGAAIYTYLGFPLWVAGVARANRRLIPVHLDLPRITVLIPACNEAEHIVAKVENTLTNGYPAERLQLLVVDDGSTDETAKLAAASGATVIRTGRRSGKCNAINAGVAAATGDIVVLTDANGFLNAGAIRRVVDQFADPTVGLVSGAKDPVGTSAHGAGERIYWKFEGSIRHHLGELGCLDGADGSIYAVRRSTFSPIPSGVLNDDYYLALAALDAGHHVTHAPGASATEDVSPTVGQEFRRRMRISAGIWQSSMRFIHLAHPRRGMLAAVFASHRLLRSMLLPCMLPVLLASSIRHRQHPVVRVVMLGQLLTYGAAAGGAVTGHRSLAVPLQFSMLNLASLGGAVRFVMGRQRVTWERIPRSNKKAENEESRVAA